jgi:hypothetical protein
MSFDQKRVCVFESVEMASATMAADHNQAHGITTSLERDGLGQFWGEAT